MTEHDNRLRAALALVELATHPELDCLTWSVGPLGGLTGGAALHYDGADIMAACAALMDTDITVSSYTSPTGAPRLSAQILTAWRGVTVDVLVSYPAPSSPAPEAALAGGVR